MWDLLIEGGAVATMDERRPGTYGLIADGAVAVAEGRIAWVGPAGERPPGEARERVDLAGGLLTPGLIDCHTHIVHGGDRAAEFEMRLSGESYEAIAQAGGGIVSTVRATRASSEEALLEGARRRLRLLMAEGATTVEVKSGYGLEREAELRMLRAARRLGAEEPARIVTSLLAAHATPPEYAENPDLYIDRVVEEIIPSAKGLADAVDAFGERIAFTPAQVERVFTAARAQGLPVKLHADQLSDQDGAALAARFGALSADHLEFASEDGAAAMGAAGTVAVLLPLAFLFLQETQRPPVDAFRRHGVAIAVATDHNPGTAPALSLHWAMALSCLLFGLTPEEAWAGVTRNAAKALGLEAETGRIREGLAADLAAWAARGPGEIIYRQGDNRCRAVWMGGRLRAFPAAQLTPGGEEGHSIQPV